MEKLRGAQVIHRLTSINAVAARGISAALLTTLRSDVKIKDVTRNCIVQLDAWEDVPDCEWALLLLTPLCPSTALCQRQWKTVSRKTVGSPIHERGAEWRVP